MTDSSDVTVRRRSQKGEQTRAHILATALRLFGEKGYQATTMRDIASEAGSSLGLTYRYFSRKEELVLAFYIQCTEELEEELEDLPAAPLAERFEHALKADIRRISPYRGAFGSLFAVALAPESEVAILGEPIAHIRMRIWNMFLKVAEGATDAPRGKQARDVATVFYAIHLMFVLFWLQDRSVNQKATEDLIVLARDTVRRARPALRLPPVARLLARMAQIIGPMFGPMPKPD